MPYSEELDNGGSTGCPSAEYCVSGRAAVHPRGRKFYRSPFRRGSETLAIVGEPGSGKSVTGLAGCVCWNETGEQISSEKMLLRRRNRQVIDFKRS